MKSSNYIIPFALGALFVSCNGKADENADTAVIEEDEVAVVEVDVAHQRSVDLHREYTANVEADNVNNISPAVSNRIQSITVDVGDNVHKGQVLATLDPANADQQRINLEQAERDYNRAVKLLEIGAGTETQVNQMKTQLDVLRTQYNNTMTNTVLKSPINGVVIARNYDPGDMTGAQPILTVGQITPNVKLIINVNESDISVIKRNQPVDITFDAFEGETFTGNISRISPPSTLPAVHFLWRCLFPIKMVEYCGHVCASGYKSRYTRQRCGTRPRSSEAEWLGKQICIYIQQRRCILQESRAWSTARRCIRVA